LKELLHYLSASVTEDLVIWGKLKLISADKISCLKIITDTHIITQILKFSAYLKTMGPVAQSL